ncbi:hypothetical protein DFQ26_002759 [Actinomortierella ambigua]|nr:hypothetical protein DFQ26_002759 [Actinomortierella ambigua]
MPYQAGLAHTVPELKTGAKHCSRCGKEFHLFRSKKNCRNCVYHLDAAALSRLNIKTLRGYLQGYNISTKGMLEKQDLINAIQSYRPIPDRSEIYFRAHLPPDATPNNASFFSDLFGAGSESGSSSGSASSTDGESGWSWDPDRFFTKLFGLDNAPESGRPPPSSSQGSRDQSTAQSQPRAAPQSRPQSQSRPHPQAQTSAQQSHPYVPHPTSYPRTPHGYSATPPHQAGQPGSSRAYPHQGYYKAGPPPVPPIPQPQLHVPSGFSYPQPQPPLPSFHARPAETARPTQATNSSSRDAFPTPGETSARTSHANSSSSFSSSSFSSTSTPAPPCQPTSQAAPQQSSGVGGGSITLEDVISSNINASSLSIKVIKTLLDSHSVSYVGIVEKSDLVARLQTLVNNTKAEQGIRDPSPPPLPTPLQAQQSSQGDAKLSSKREEGTEDDTKGDSSKSGTDNSSETNATSGAAAQSSHYNEDEDMCKICYDAKLNCVMLNCGHLATCQPCGKLIMDGTRTCPICRQYVIRLLHVFRA